MTKLEISNDPFRKIKVNNNELIVTNKLDTKKK